MNKCVVTGFLVPKNIPPVKWRILLDLLDQLDGVS